VALICYSHGLASYLERLTATWSYKERPGYVGEFHALGQRWGATEWPDESIRNTDTVQFWEHDLPRHMAVLASELPLRDRFDAVVVDEAQDFADDWWGPLLAALRDEETGGIYVFGDEGQRVFDRQGVPPVQLVPLVLDHNLRNTRQIADSFTPLVGQRMRLLGGEGPEVLFVPCTAEDALTVADHQIDVDGRGRVAAFRAKVISMLIRVADDTYLIGGGGGPWGSSRGGRGPRGSDCLDNEALRLLLRWSR